MLLDDPIVSTHHSNPPIHQIPYWLYNTQGTFWGAAQDEVRVTRPVPGNNTWVQLPIEVYGPLLKSGLLALSSNG